MRQAGRAEDQRDAQREQVHLAVERLQRVAGCLHAVAQPGFEERRSLARGAGRVAEQRGQVELVLGEHQQRHRQRAAHQQERLDDLYVRGALHAADRHVDDHQGTDHDDGGDLGGVGVHAEERGVRLDAEQQGDERARADHLGQQVEDRHGDGGDRRRGPDRPLPHPERQHVRHRVPAGVAQQFRHQQQRHQPGDQEADRVEEAVVAVERDDAGDAQEGRRRHVVAADRHAVLEAGEGPAAGVEVGGGLGLPAGPDGDRQRDRHEDQEQRDGEVPGGGAARLSREDRVHGSPPRSRRGSGRRPGRSGGWRTGSRARR